MRLYRIRKVRADGMATAARLLAAAEQEFADRGFSEARLSAIAERASVARATVLHHFASKQALFEAVVRTALLRLDEVMLLEIQGADTADQRLSAAIGAMTAHFEEQPQVARLIVGELITDAEGARPELRKSLEALLDRSEYAIRRGGPALETSLSTRTILLQALCTCVIRSCATPRLRLSLWGDRSAAATPTPTQLEIA